MSFQPAHHYVRHPLATAITTAGRILFTRPGEVPHIYQPVEPGAASELWEALATPICGRDLVARADIAPQGVARLIDSLVEHAIVLPWTAEELESDGSPVATRPASLPCGDLVWGIAGAVQAIFAPHYVQRLSSCFAERLNVVLTASAREFVQPRALSVLGAHVWSEVFDTQAPARVPHIELAARAELVLVLPATADAIFRLAHGACTDLLSLIVSATRAPVVVAPAMNSVMWQHPATRRNVKLLRDDGVFLVEPGAASSAADGATQQIGGLGFGPGGANLVDTLATILRLSKSGHPPPAR